MPAADNAVIEHLEYSAVSGLYRVQLHARIRELIDTAVSETRNRKPEDHKAHVVHRGVSHQTLEIPLAKRSVAAKDNAQHTECRQNPGRQYSPAAGNSGMTSRKKP